MRHAERDAPLLDYDVALLLEPLTLVGTVLGVLLNVVLQSWQVRRGSDPIGLHLPFTLF